MLNKRLNLLISDELYQMLRELAEENAGDNESLMVRKLIERAHANPRGVNLYPPKIVAPSAIQMAGANQN